MTRHEMDNAAMSGHFRVEVDTIPNVLSFFALGSIQGVTLINNRVANHNYVVASVDCPSKRCYTPCRWIKEVRS